jgi:hypothetical protein
MSISSSKELPFKIMYNMESDQNPIAVPFSVSQTRRYLIMDIMEYSVTKET